MNQTNFQALLYSFLTHKMTIFYISHKFNGSSRLTREIYNNTLRKTLVLAILIVNL